MRRENDRRRAGRVSPPPGDAPGAHAADASPGSRAARRAKRRDEILTAALALVAEGGLDAVTTPALAERTGAALGALYRFFPSKAAVIAALQRQAITELYAALVAATAAATTAAAAAGPAAQALAALVAIADVVFGEPQENPPRFRLVDEALSRLDAVHADDDAAALEAALGPLIALAHGHVVAFVGARGGQGGNGERADEDDGAEELERFSLVLWAALHGVTHFRKRDRLVRDAHRSAKVATTAVRLLLRGLGATDDAIDAAWRTAAPRALFVPERRWRTRGAGRGQ
jgi:AcrR family transcriptional regulator